MSAIKIIRLRCDVIGCPCVLLAEGSTIAVREQALSEGWDSRPTNKRAYVDVCPKHVVELRAGTSLTVKSSGGVTEIGKVPWSGWHRKQPPAAGVDILPREAKKAHS